MTVESWSGFAFDPAEGERISRATLGNPAAQVSVTFEQKGTESHRTLSKIITFFDPKTKSYCVARYDDRTNKFRLMSWHRSPASYGEGEWEIKGKPVLKLDEDGKPVMNENGKPVMITDKDRQRDYFISRKNKKGRKP